MNRLRESVADAFGGDARNFRDGKMHDSSFVRIERAELLIDSGVASFFRQILGHPSQLDVLALAIGERNDEDPLIVGEVAAKRRVDDSVVEYLSAMWWQSHRASPLGQRLPSYRPPPVSRAVRRRDESS